VADPAGKGLELGTLRVVFEVHRGDLQSPNSCDIRVYNLADDTANQIDTEFTQLALKVGYGFPDANGNPPPLGLIFQGSIKQVRKGREDQKNSYGAITAADGDEPYCFAVMARTLAAGATPADSIQVLIQQMARRVATTPTGGNSGTPVTQGYIPPLVESGYIRGRVHYGFCRDEARDLAMDADCTWSIQDGKFTMIPLTAPLPGPTVIITRDTGLVGVPEQTQNGLSMRVLMNPNIKIGQQVQLVDSDINQFRYGLDINSNPINSTLAKTTTKLNGAGLYYVMRADHFGDTRGTAWYTDLTCLAINADVPAFSLPQSAISPVLGAVRDQILRY
jgi:hypothetical protein